MVKVLKLRLLINDIWEWWWSLLVLLNIGQHDSSSFEMFPLGHHRDPFWCKDGLDADCVDEGVSADPKKEAKLLESQQPDLL